MTDSAFDSVKSLFRMTDEQAMWRVQMHEDAHAFAQLMKRWEEPIRRLCTRLTGDVHRAEDLTQEAFTRIFTRRKDYRAGGRFSTYLWRIALNLCYDDLRRTRRRGEAFLEDQTGEEFSVIDHMATQPSPDTAMVQEERADMVRRALMRLPDNHRSVIVLRHYEGLKFREIAEVLEIPEGTVKSRMADGLTQLSRMLQPVWDETSPNRGSVRLSRRNKNQPEQLLI
jgi:RNA polymerase sigma-70 factor, ECF subfamily